MTNQIHFCSDKTPIGFHEYSDPVIRSHDGSTTVCKDNYAPVVLNGDVYPSTVRTSQCELLVNGGKCDPCKQYRGVLES